MSALMRRAAGGWAPLAAVAFVLWTSCGGMEGRLPSEVSHFPGDLGNSNLEASGIYPDGWAAGAVSLNLGQPHGKNVLAIRGVVPNISDPGFHTDVSVRLDNRELARQSLGVGEFRIQAPAQGEGKHRVELTFSAAQELPGGDGRRVGARLQFIGFEEAHSREATQASDIVRGSGLQLGSGWGVLETFRNERFRWVDNNARILLTPPKSGDVQVSLLVEPGPGLGGAFLLQALDASGRRVDAVRVDRRGTVQLFLPAEAGKSNEFQLHVNGGGKPTPNDPRNLNFRVFQIGVESLPGQS